MNQDRPLHILDALGGELVHATLALACAERAGAIVERLAASPDIREAAASSVALGWCALVEPLDTDVLDHAVSSLDSAVSAANDDLGEYHGYLDDAISTIAYALDAVRLGDPRAAENALARSREIAFQLAQELWPTLSLAGLDSSPLVQQEVMRQVRDSERISSARDGISSDLLASLRHVARQEGSVLADSILGVPQKAPRVEKQPPLF